MTHAWLLTGPPGSGRSTAARVFAAALQCPDGGCGTCDVCHQVLGRGHADVDQFTPEKLQITAEESLELIRRASMTPIMGRWNVLIVEDADRLNDVSGNALLKSLEEPSPRTVWILCAPTPEDVLPTIVSRTRQVRLRTPTTREVTEALVRREGVDPALASFAARAAQGHIGRARALAGDEQVRLRRSGGPGHPGDAARPDVLLHRRPEPPRRGLGRRGLDHRRPRRHRARPAQPRLRRGRHGSDGRPGEAHGLGGHQGPRDAAEVPAHPDGARPDRPGAAGPDRPLPRRAGAADARPRSS